MSINSRLNRLEKATGAKRRVRSMRELSTPELVALLKHMGTPVTRGPDGEEQISDAFLEAAATSCPTCVRLGDTCESCRAVFQRACEAVGVIFVGNDAE